MKRSRIIIIAVSAVLVVAAAVVVILILAMRGKPADEPQQYYPDYAPADAQFLGSDWLLMFFVGDDGTRIVSFNMATAERRLVYTGSDLRCEGPCRVTQYGGRVYINDNVSALSFDEELTTFEVLPVPEQAQYITLDAMRGLIYYTTDEGLFGVPFAGGDPDALCLTDDLGAAPNSARPLMPVLSPEFDKLAYIVLSDTSYAENYVAVRSLVDGGETRLHITGARRMAFADGGALCVYETLLDYSDDGLMYPFANVFAKVALVSGDVLLAHENYISGSYMLYIDGRGALVFENGKISFMTPDSGNQVYDVGLASITTAALSPDGRYIAATGIEASGGPPVALIFEIDMGSRVIVGNTQARQNAKMADWYIRRAADMRALYNDMLARPDRTGLLDPHLGGRPLGDIDFDMVREAYLKLVKGEQVTASALADINKLPVGPVAITPEIAAAFYDYYVRNNIEYSGLPELTRGAALTPEAMLGFCYGMAHSKLDDGGVTPKSIDEAAERYFGGPLTRHESTEEFDFTGEYYVPTGAAGDAGQLIPVLRSLRRNEDGTFTARFINFFFKDGNPFDADAARRILLSSALRWHTPMSDQQLIFSINEDGKSFKYIGACRMDYTPPAEGAVLALPEDVAIGPITRMKSINRGETLVLATDDGVYFYDVRGGELKLVYDTSPHAWWSMELCRDALAILTDSTLVKLGFGGAVTEIIELPDYVVERERGYSVSYDLQSIAYTRDNNLYVNYIDLSYERELVYGTPVERETDANPYEAPDIYDPDYEPDQSAPQPVTPEIPANPDFIMDDTYIFYSRLYGNSVMGIGVIRPDGGGSSFFDGEIAQMPVRHLGSMTGGECFLQSGGDNRSLSLLVMNRKNPENFSVANVISGMQAVWRTPESVQPGIIDASFSQNKQYLYIMTPDMLVKYSYRPDGVNALSVMRAAEGETFERLTALPDGGVAIGALGAGGRYIRMFEDVALPYDGELTNAAAQRILMHAFGGMSLFTQKTLPYDSVGTLVGVTYYYPVRDRIIKSVSDLRDYLGMMCTQEVVDKLMDTKMYIDIGGELYTTGLPSVIEPHYVRDYIMERVSTDDNSASFIAKYTIYADSEFAQYTATAVYNVAFERDESDVWRISRHEEILPE